MKKRLLMIVLWAGLLLSAGWTGAAVVKEILDGSVAYLIPPPVANYVAVGNATGTGGSVITSSDGVTWTRGVSASNVGLYGATYGAGLYVIVGGPTGVGADIETSPDGFTWTVRANPVDTTLYSVTYGGGLYVAVGERLADTTGYILTSPDGTVWTQRVSPTMRSGFPYRNVIYGNGLYVIIGSKQTGGPAINRIVTSPDGITWTLIDQPGSCSTRFFTDVFHSTNGFLTAGPYQSASDATRCMATSPDGVTWSRYKPAICTLGPGPCVFAASVIGSGTYVLAGGAEGLLTGGPSLTADPGIVYSSPDGTTWTQRTNPNVDAAIMSVLYKTARFLAVGTNTQGCVAGGGGCDPSLYTDYIISSPTGVTWTEISPAGGNGLNAMASNL
jgi:hypothetical protein